MPAELLWNYGVHHFVKDTVEAQFIVFDQIDRGGKDPVIREIYSTATEDVAVVALGAPSGGNSVQDIVQQRRGFPT
jgi:polyphosphate kinase 2 (PPK2 family)